MFICNPETCRKDTQAICCKFRGRNAAHSAIQIIFTKQQISQHSIMKINTSLGWPFPLGGLQFPIWQLSIMSFNSMSSVFLFLSYLWQSSLTTFESMLWAPYSFVHYMYGYNVKHKNNYDMHTLIMFMKRKYLMPGGKKKRVCKSSIWSALKLTVLKRQHFM